MENSTSHKFAELYKIDVSKKSEKKGKFSYLSWSWAWSTLKEYCPDANFIVHKNANNMPLFYDKEFPSMGAFVEVSVTVNDITHTINHPILDNFNKTIELAKINAFTINTSVQRALAKAIALHGLGLYIYNGEDLPEAPEQTQNEEEHNPFIYVATGRTYNHKETFKKSGFNWDEQARAWYIRLAVDSTKELPVIDGVEYVKVEE